MRNVTFTSEAIETLERLPSSLRNQLMRGVHRTRARWASYRIQVAPMPFEPGGLMLLVLDTADNVVYMIGADIVNGEYYLHS